MKKLLSVALVALFGLTGCMQIEYGIVLEEDLSGTADIDFALDMDRMAYSFAMVQKMFSGQKRRRPTAWPRWRARTSVKRR